MVTPFLMAKRRPQQNWQNLRPECPVAQLSPAVEPQVENIKIFRQKAR